MDVGGYKKTDQQVMKSTIFWDITPFSPSSFNRRFGGTYRLHLQVCHLLSRWFLAQRIFSTLKMEAICSSAASVDTQRTTQRYIPEDSTFHNLNSYTAKEMLIKMKEITGSKP
jgi:hypothetical protein